MAVDIPLPWYSAQALATVARAAPEDRVEEVLDRAMKKAGSDPDAYRRVAVVAWVVEAAIARDRRPLALRYLDIALSGISEVTPMKSRAAALELLLGAAAFLGERPMHRAAEALLDAAAALSASPFKKWQKWGVSYVNRAARILSGSDPRLARQILAARLGPDQAQAVLARHGQP